jgi:predicted permease
MNFLVLRPLPYPDRDHLVRIYRTTPQSQTANHLASDFLDLIPATSEFADLAAFRMWGFTLAQDGHPPVNLNALRVSAGFFPAIGLQPALGRVFSPAEDQLGNHVIVLSYETWQAQFGGDPGVIGRTVRIDSESTTVIGVMPASFSSVFLWGPGEAFRPLALTDAEKRDRNDSSLSIIGRIHSGITMGQADARLAAIVERLAPNRPLANSKDGLHVVSLQSLIQSRSTVQISLLLLSLGGFVLLIACANLANLQMARAVARTREFGIRAAMGASRRRMLGPLLAESTLLALAGGAAGILIAVWANDWISSSLSGNGFVKFTISLDWRVLSFALVVSVLTGLIFGIVPAWIMARVNVNQTLKSGARGSTGDRTQHRFRHALIIGQFALALVLLAGAGFFTRGLNRMLSREVGWTTTHLLQGIINLPAGKYSTPEKTYFFYTQLQQRLGALPGVEHVAIGWTLPIFQFFANRNYVVEGRDLPAPGREPLAGVNAVTPSYLETLKIKLTSGRNFSEADKPGAPAVVIINESMANALFPHENPLGRSIGGLDPKNRDWMEVVGVVSDFSFAVSFNLPASRFMVLRPLAQETWNYATFAVRADSAESLAQPVREAIVAMDPDMAVQQLTTVTGFVAQTVSSSTMIKTILVCFAMLGLFLASLGLYGVIARLVTQRTPEIGVRMALGAQSGDVIWLVLSLGIKLTAIGSAFGLVGAWLLGRFLTSILPTMTSSDALSVIMATFLLTIVSLLACWLPARRAANVDPMVALRAE